MGQSSINSHRSAGSQAFITRQLEQSAKVNNKQPSTPPKTNSKLSPAKGGSKQSKRNRSQATLQRDAYLSLGKPFSPDLLPTRRHSYAADGPRSLGGLNAYPKPMRMEDFTTKPSHMRKELNKTSNLADDVFGPTGQSNKLEEPAPAGSIGNGMGELEWFPHTLQVY